MKKRIFTLIFTAIFIFTITASAASENVVKSYSELYNSEKEEVQVLAEEYLVWVAENGKLEADPKEIFMDQAYRAEVYLSLDGITPKDIINGTAEPYCICWHIPCITYSGNPGILYADIINGEEVSFSSQMTSPDKTILPTNEILGKELGELFTTDIHTMKYIAVYENGNSFFFLTADDNNVYAIPHRINIGGTEPTKQLANATENTSSSGYRMMNADAMFDIIRKGEAESNPIENTNPGLMGGAVGNHNTAPDTPTEDIVETIGAEDPADYTLWIVLGVAVVLAAGGTGGWFWYKKNKKA